MAREPDEDLLWELYRDTGSSKSFVQSVVDLYITQSEEFIAATSNKPRAELAPLAHKFAGSNFRLGMTQVGQTALELEKEINEGSPESDRLDQIVQRLPSLIASLEEWVNALPADDDGSPQNQ